jgi:hypothetical protein
MNSALSCCDDRHAAGGDIQAVRDMVNSACRSSDIEMVAYVEALSGYRLRRSTGWVESVKRLPRSFLQLPALVDYVRR